MTSEDASFATTSGPYRRRRSRGWVAIALLAFLIGIGATLAVLRYVAPRLGWTDATHVAAPTAQPTPAPAATPPVQTAVLPILSAREAALAARIADLETRIVGLDNSARNAASYATRAEDMMVIVATRRALDRGRPLEYLESQLRDRFGTSRPDAVRTVIAAAQAPVTLDDLRSALDAVATPLLAGPSGEGFWNGLRREFGQLIVLRQGPTPSSRPIDRLDRARRRLDTGQVEMAMAEIERMPGAASARSWTAAAARYVEARRALVDLEAVALTTPRPDPAPVAPTAPVLQPLPDAAAPATPTL